MRTGERITIAALRLLEPILPRAYRGNPAQDIAAALLHAALSGLPGTHFVGAGEIG